MAHTQDRVIHYAPGSVLGPGGLPAATSPRRRSTAKTLARWAGCADCLELVAEAPKNLDWYRGYCVNCMQEISAQGGLAWRRIVREPCPYCSRAGW